MNKNTLLWWMVLGGTLLGCSYPPMPTNVLAVIAFLPFFLLMEEIGSYWRALRYAYGFFFIFHLIALYWPGGFVHGKDVYMMIAGIATLLVHPLFFLITIPPLIFLKNRFGYSRAILAFPCIWVGYEYFHTMSEYSFPWLLLGNTQTYNLASVQIASFTGVYGVSFWIVTINVAFYFLYKNVAIHGWKGVFNRSKLSVFVILVLYFLPILFGMIVLNRGKIPNHTKRSLSIAMVQPNIDPFDKWTCPPEEQIAIQESMTVQAGSRADLVLWCETAIPTYILHPNHAMNFLNIRRMVDSLGICLLSGIPDIIYYSDEGVIPGSAQTAVNGRRFDTYNSSMLLTARSDVIQKYHKIHLVPFAERVPYAEILSFMNAMKWNFGLGGWGIGQDTTIFFSHDRSGKEYRFSNAICFESVYPGFVAQFVKKGAEFITITTNDSWWGNTSGVYQHEQVAVLRAIENRRWVVQCSNGGISCIIDPWGHTFNASTFNTRTIVYGEIEPSDDLSFYTTHGDWFAEACLILCGCFIAAGFGMKTYKSIRAKENI